MQDWRIPGIHGKQHFNRSFYIGTRFHKMSHVTSFRSAWNVATEHEGTRRTRAFEVVVSALPITDSSFFQRFGASEGSTHRIDPNPSLPPADSGARQSDRHPQGCRHNQGLSLGIYGWILKRWNHGFYKERCGLPVFLQRFPSSNSMRLTKSSLNHQIMYMNCFCLNFW